MGFLGDFDSLKSQRDFSYVYKNAKKWHCDIAVIYFLEDNNRKLGVVASKKVGNAVKRNRAKRVLRASFFGVSNTLKVGSYILIAKTPIVSEKYSNINKMLRWSFKRLGCLE